MDKNRPGRKDLKAEVEKLLKTSEPERILAEIKRLPLRGAINALFSHLCDGDEQIRQRAIEAMGEAVARLAKEDMEAARNIMRRLMWSLNDESGGIGWGAPEAMAEIMARHNTLAEEFAHILVSYIMPEGNYLEYGALQKGAVWGIMRLAQKRPDLVRNAAPFLAALSESENGETGNLAKRALALMEENN